MSATPPVGARAIDPARNGAPAAGTSRVEVARAMHQAQQALEVKSPSAFAPVLIFFLAWLAWAVFQAVQLNEEAKSLALLRANQEGPVQQAQRVRQTLDALASETQRLADAGNANAKAVIDELRKRGITVNRPAVPLPAQK